MAAVNGVIRSFDQLSAAFRARLTASGGLSPSAGAISRTSERVTAAAAAADPPVTTPAPAAGGAIDAGSGDALNTTV